MVYVDVKGIVGNPKGPPRREIEFVVNTGTFHSAIPKDLAVELGLQVAGEISVPLAGKREVRSPISLAYMRVLDR